MLLNRHTPNTNTNVHTRAHAHTHPRAHPHAHALGRPLGPFNSWDRLPYLTTVGNGTASLRPAWNHLVQNLFFSGSPFSIDTDDGSDWLNVSSNVVYKQPLFKLDYGGHSKAGRNPPLATDNLLEDTGGWHQ